MRIQEPTSECGGWNRINVKSNRVATFHRVWGEKKSMDTPLLQQISAILKVPVEAIQNFDEAGAIAYFNTFNDNSANHGTIGNNYDCTLNFNPLDKMVELYERMLQQQKEMIEKLERLIEGK